MPVGELVLRFRYPDGRITALISIDDDWKVEVFASEERARQFAKNNDLTVKEMESGTDED